MDEHHEPRQFVAPPNLLEADCDSITPSLLTLVELDQHQIDSIVQTVPGGAKNVQDIYPLTPLQEGILFHRLLNERNDSYVLSTLFELSSSAEVARLVDALQRVIDRHDILRSAVLWQDLPRPMQVVYRRAILHTQELQLDPHRDPTDQLRERMRPGCVALDVRRAPIGQLQVAAHSEGQKCYALLQLHHLVCDHQSLTTIVSEALMCLQGREQLLPAPIAYRNYVADALTLASTEESEVFFRRKLGEIEEPTAPFELTDVQGDGTQVEEARQIIDVARARKLRAQAQCSGTSAARLFHAAWALVVAHTTGRDDVVFGTVLLARQQRSAIAQRMLGLSVNTLPLRLLIRDLTAKELVEHTHCELIELLNHEHAPLSLAQRCSGISGTAPLFTALLNYRHSAPDPQIEHSGGAAVRVLARGEAWSNYPVALTVDDTGEEFVLTAQTDRRIDPHRVIGYLDTAVQSLAEALERTPQTRALALSILPESERHQVVERFNATRTDYSQEKRISELFEEQAKRTPDAIAVVCGDQRLTYIQLNRRANHLAHALRARGVRPNERVALYVERSPELVIGLLGILKAGGAYVPLDVGYPAERVAYMLQDSAPVAVLTQKCLTDTLPPTAAYVLTLDTDEDGIDQEPDRNLEGPQLGFTSRDLAYVIYTSGSTGAPKGVMVEHRNLVNLVQWHCATFELREGSRCSGVASVGFDAATWEIWPPLTIGATLVLSSSELADDTGKLIDWWANEALDVSFLPTPLAEFAFSRQTTNSQLRTLLVGGDRLRYRPVSRSFSLINNYGPTETTVVATSGRIHDDDPILHIGHPIANTQIYILDRYGQVVPIGVTAEIHIGGVGVARGYLNRPELTAERFVPDPYSRADPCARMYKTGDLGRWRADGTIEYLGRNDQQVKIRGFRIEPAEIEGRLALHEQVEGAVVVAREDVAGEKHLVAYIVQGAQSAPSVEDLRGYLKAALPEYMVPSAFVLLERLPLTPNGKLDRRALPAPGLGAYASRPYSPPQGDLERTLAAIWEELLGLARIGRDDNFFGLGGHSLLIVQMMERLRRVGLSVQVRRVFETPTLAELAAALSSEAVEEFEVPPNRIPSACDAITPQMLPLVELEADQIERIVRSVPGGAANVQDIYPLTPLQEGMLFHHLLGEQGADTYVVLTVLSLSSRERLEELIAALQAVIDRHDILRTAVLWEQLPLPVQVVYRQVTLPVEEFTLDRDRAPMEQIKEWIKPERQRVDLRQAPLIRLQVAADPHGAQWYVLLQAHHIAGDNTSQEIVTSEVVARLEGRAQTLAESTQYRNHVAQALAYAGRHDADAFFRGKLGDIDEPTAPFGLFDVHGDGSQIEEAREELEPALAQRARVQARRLSVSAATLFHAAWGLVVSRTSGRDDVVFGSVLLGRLQGNAGAPRMLGMFINTLPLRLQLLGVTAQELVEQAQRELVGLLSHEQASLAVAQRCSGIVGSAPLFSALLNYRHSIPNLDAQWSSASGIQVLAGQDRTNYPITVSVDDLREGFRLTAQTDRRIDPHRITGYLHEAVKSLVEALEQAPYAPALALSVLPEDEHRQVIEQFNATHAAYPQQKLVHELFEEQVERTPEAVAVVYKGQLLTYAELNRRANQLAWYLRDRGVGPDQLVGICVERGTEMVIGLLGILKAGGAYVPLDPSYPAERLAYMLSDAVPRVLLVQERLRERLPETAALVIALDSDWTAVTQRPSANLDARTLGLESHHLAYVIYTSGSTGQPKGVAIEHRNTVNLICWARYSMGRKVFSQTLQSTSLNFDLSVYECFVPLTTGGTIRVVENALALMKEPAEVTLINSVPSAIAGLLESGSIPETTRVVNLAGEVLQEELVERIFAHSQVERICNLYGPSETTTYSTWVSMSRKSGFISSIGRPIANTQIYILNRSRQVVPIGVVGEIYIGGAGVARGYLNRPELTAERFLQDPFSADPQARMYKTGDLGRWRPDETIEYLGRNDHQVKIRGFRIELGEIEAQLIGHGAVKEAVVLVREDMPGEKRLVAYVIPRHSGADTVPSAEGLRKQLRAVLPEYMVPSAFVMLKRLPLTPNGKLDRRALPAPEIGTFVSRQYEAPQGELEQLLAGIWQTLLRVERVGRQDNFFELGGHSLLATRVISRIRERLQVELSVRTLFDAPTVKQLSARVEAEEGTRAAQEALWMSNLSRDLRRDIDGMHDDEVAAAIAELEQEFGNATSGESARA
jgi:amino acid adenylation domain-containing protein